MLPVVAYSAMIKVASSSPKVKMQHQDLLSSLLGNHPILDDAMKSLKSCHEFSLVLYSCAVICVEAVFLEYQSWVIITMAHFGFRK